MAEIYLHLNGEQKGPFPVETVRAMLAAGEGTPETLAWHPGLSQWSTVAALVGPPPVPGAPGIPPVPLPPVKSKPMSTWLIVLLAVLGVGVLTIPCCCGVALGPITNGIKRAKENVALQHSRTIALAMMAYAEDHHGHYPDAGEGPAAGSVVTIGGGSPGASTSTEVFQRLIDGHYVTDPAIFYFDMPGKVKPVGDRLAANNVCYDVTAGLTTDSPSGIPMVYPTGYTVTFSGDIRVTRGAGAPYDRFITTYTGGAARDFQVTTGQSVNLGPIGNFLAVHLRQLQP